MFEGFAKPCAFLGLLLEGLLGGTATFRAAVHAYVLRQTPSALSGSANYTAILPTLPPQDLGLSVELVLAVNHLTLPQVYFI